MKELKDYINLYIGQLIQHTLNDDNDIVISRVTGYYSDGIEVQLVHNGEHKCILPHFKDAKLILRRLDSMTEEEAKEIGWWDEGEIHYAKDFNSKWMFSAENMLYLLSKGFDLFDLIDAGLAIEDKPATP
jgi:hypothetical protein